MTGPDVSKPRRVAGIDIGGTFTDLILFEDVDGRQTVQIAKLPTTTDDRAAGVLAALAATGVDPADIDLIIHGTTATTNAVLERKIAKVGLITTRGFRDILELGRRTRPQPYGMTGTFEPLIPRELRLEVTERMGARGDINTPLDAADVEAATRQLLAAGCESIVIHFLHAYANPVHELQAEAIVARLWPNSFITRAAGLLSEYREYERGTTASVNAATQPILARYVSRLQDALSARGYQRDLLLMNGNGGTVAARLAVNDAAKTVMSGPASGVMAASATLAASGLVNAITYDMGGTSTDVALIHGGTPEVSSALTIAYGLPIHVPMVDVRTVGSGGGSIAWIDAAGMLKVGPESAGSQPGPICFGRGGRRPTITDANLLLGRLPPDRLTAVDRAIPLDEVRERFAETLATPLGVSVEAAADAVIRLANLTMAGTIRLVSLSRGHDPRDFVLFAFGGAGPLHAVALARELGIPEVLVPARPGLTNALGCLVADLRQDFVTTLNVALDGADMEHIARVLDDHEQRGRAINAADGDEVVATVVQHAADMQFSGQTHVIRVALPAGPLTRATIQALFERNYFARFQVELPEIKAQLVNLTTSVIGRRRSIPIATLAPAAPIGRIPIEATRQLYADGRWHEARVVRRDALAPGATLVGPAIIEQMDATTVIEPGAHVRVDDIGNLRIQA